MVGASSGIGEALACQLARGGCHVALVARRADALTALAASLNDEAKAALASAYPHDVLDIAAVPALFQQITQDMGGLDLIIYASGVMPRIAAREYDTAKDQQVIAVNFLGAVAWLNEAARRFDIARAGTIVGISSVAGDRGRRGYPVYNASKAALNTYLEALRYRLAGRGVSVVTVKPGFVATAMTQGMGRLPGVIPAEQAASEILRAARDGASVAYVPGWWRYAMAVIRAIPGSIFRYLPI